MYCKNCGQQISDNASFCEHCGADQRSTSEVRQEAPVYQPAEPQQNWQSAYSPVSNPAPVKGSTYLIWAILVTLFCCLPLGIPAIVYASKIDSCNAQGDFAGAAENAGKSKKLMIIGAVVSVVLYLLCFVLSMATGISGLYY